MTSMNAGRARSPALARIERGRLCAGCGGCAGAVAPGKIDMAVSSDGFLRPVQKGALSDAEERLLSDICPGFGVTLGQPEDADELAAPASGTVTKVSHDPFWGPIVAAYTGHATDAALRWEASSGGALSAILVHLLESGAVDFVVQTAADPENPAGNRTVVSRTAEEIRQAAGSRYAPSAPLEELAEMRALPGRGAFVGKPCDIAALRSLIAHDPALGAKLPYLVSFFCAGVPSLTGAREIIDTLGMGGARLRSFRYRGQGWPGNATATDVDGRSASMSYAESWGRILTRHVQWRCKLCPDGAGALADIVCGDAWLCDERGYPVFDDADGRSLVIARTGRGAAVLDRSVADGHLAVQPVEAGEIGPMQPGQVFRKSRVLSRLLALAVLGRPRPRYPGFPLARIARIAGVGGNLHSFAGTCRRALRLGKDRPA